MEKTTLYLPDDLRHELRAAARQSGRSQAELIRNAVRSFLDARPPALPRSVGAVSDGSFDARDDEAYLADAWNRKWAEQERARREPRPE